MSCFSATYGDRWFNKTKQQKEIHCFAFESNFAVESSFLFVIHIFRHHMLFLLDEVISPWYAIIICHFDSFFFFSTLARTNNAFPFRLLKYSTFFLRKRANEKRNNDIAIEEVLISLYFYEFIFNPIHSSYLFYRESRLFPFFPSKNK